ncbi:ricin B-like lectin R40C1 [Ananas comosus]|uniref:Ricin B-like lectin R40C1 n=1 Tax=Ananas comosus TaxID=4615 RepID=A0A6P5GGU8_ANACO|nr:ricin B-like lectin R40C1 [Ananas comosus]
MGFNPGDVGESDAKQMQQTISINKVENLYLGCCGSCSDPVEPIAAPTPTWWYDPRAHGPTVTIFCRRDANYSLTVRGDSVVLAPTDPEDDRQCWIKDNRVNSKVRDEEGHASFALVNKATGQAIKHSFGHGHPVRLIQYNPCYVDESVLWTESDNLIGGFREIRMVNNLDLHFDALTGFIEDGTTLGLFKTNNADNQRWKMVPYSTKEEGEKQFPTPAVDGNLTQLISNILSNLNSSSRTAYPLIPRYSTLNWYDDCTTRPTMRIFCRAGVRHSLAVRGENVVLEQANRESDYQASISPV